MDSLSCIDIFFRRMTNYSGSGSLQVTLASSTSGLFSLTDEDKFSIQELYDYINPDASEWILISIYIFTFLVGVTGNILVCISVWRNTGLRTVTNIFIVNLSAADLFITIFLLPSILLVDVTATWFIGIIPCKLHLSLATLTISVSVMTLCAISVERWYAICHPLRFHSTVRRARYIIAVIWVISSCIALPELITATVIPYRSDTVLFSACYPALWDDETIVIFQICLMIGLYFLPLAIMAFSYTQIALVLWRGNVSERIELGTLKPMINGAIRLHENRRQMENRRKAIKMLITIVVVFALSFLPNHTLNIIRYTGHLEHIPNKRLFALFAHWATFFNSCINPIIYNFMCDSFRRAFRVTMRSCVRCRKERRIRRRPSTYIMAFTASRRYSNNNMSS